MKTIGIDIGGTKCAISQLEGEGRVIERLRFATLGPKETIGRLLAGVASLPIGDDPRFGISCGGPLNSATGTILSPPNLPGWDEVRICDAFTSRFGGRASLMNDANASALAEWQFGAGRGSRSMVFLTAGTGMGSGLILDGKLYEGACGNAGEVGHIRLRDDGPEGFGKRGSFEGFCGGAGIARLARERGWPDSAVTAKSLADAAFDGNRQALEIWTEVGTRLGEALAILVDLINPERIVLGSVYVRCRSLLEGAMLSALERESLGESLRCCTVLPSELGDEIGSYAAVAVASYHLRGEPAAVMGR